MRVAPDGPWRGGRIREFNASLFLLRERVPENEEGVYDRGEEWIFWDFKIFTIGEGLFLVRVDVYWAEKNDHAQCLEFARAYDCPDDFAYYNNNEKYSRKIVGRPIQNGVPYYRKFMRRRRQRVNEDNEDNEEEEQFNA